MQTALFRPGAGTPPVPSAQVLAAVLLETPSATGNSTLRVVALATGAHHAPLPRQDDGALRDCRAEVLALRAFRRFLCSQLQQALQREAQETHPEISLSSGPGPGSVTDDRMESNETGGAADAEAGPSSNAALGGEGAQAAVTDGAMTSGSGGLLSNGVEESRAAKRAKVDGAEEGSAGQLPVPVLEAAALGQESGDAALTALTAVTEAAEGGTSVEGPGALDGVEVAADSGVAEGEAVVRGEDGQWRLREGTKVHLWVSTPMARRGNGGAANDGERQSRRAKVRQSDWQLPPNLREDC